MSRDDRDRRAVDPDEDAPITPAEQARAEAFGRWVDGLAAGEPLPPAMDSEDRALLETATMVLASSRAIELPSDRTHRLVDQALEGALFGRRRPASDSGAGLGTWPGTRRATSPPPGEASRAPTDMVVSPRRRRADRVLRNLPWAVASLAAAAAVFLFVTRPDERVGPPRAAASRPVRLRLDNTSRPADPLIGVIRRGDTDRASERLDILFADRMDGYRDLTLRRALGEEQP
jgi:hypothetical protein